MKGVAHLPACRVTACKALEAFEQIRDGRHSAVRSSHSISDEKKPMQALRASTREHTSAGMSNCNCKQLLGKHWN